MISYSMNAYILSKNRINICGYNAFVIFYFLVVIVISYLLILSSYLDCKESWILGTTGVRDCDALEGSKYMHIGTVGNITMQEKQTFPVVKSKNLDYDNIEEEALRTSIASPKGQLKSQTLIRNQRNILHQCNDEFSLPKEVHLKFKNQSQVSFYDAYEPDNYTDTVVILTPVSNSAKKLKHYFQLLCSLSYPRHLISVALGEDSSTDDTLEMAKTFVNQIERSFRAIRVFNLSESMNLKPIPYALRHKEHLQFDRRVHLAHARNQLLFAGLADEDWVLWIDSDVEYVPQDIIQHLLSAKADVVAASCVYIKSGTKRIDVYDRNSWQETEESRKFLASQPADFLMLEGYSSRSRRRYLPLLGKDTGALVVDLDGVGGCALLIRAKCHRQGLVFPAFLFEHHLETEGLAKMAKRMGFSVKGLPFVNVFH